MAAVPRVLLGGDLYARFWHLLDRFYYEFYGPWRESHRALMDETVHRAEEGLGARRGTGFPSTEWLPARNPLNNFPDLPQHIQDRGLNVYFLVEPLNMDTFIGVQPDTIIVDCAQSQAGLDAWRELTEDIVDELKALADPSRMMILGLISELSLSNTQMGNYLGLSRSTVSIHTKILREAGLIESRADGRTTKHTINHKAMRTLLRRLEKALNLPQEDPTDEPDREADPDEAGPIM